MGKCTTVDIPIADAGRVALSDFRSIAVVLSVLTLAACDGALIEADSTDDSEIFVLELDEEVGPIDDGLSADEPQFYLEGDYAFNASAATDDAPQIGAALPANAIRKQEGAWSQVFNWPVSPIHMSLLPDESILTYGTNPDVENATGFTLDKWFSWRGFGSDAHETTPTGIETNLFCSAQTVLPDGNLLISGGDGHQVGDRTYKNDGIDATTIFDYETNLIFNGPAMNFARWYPTLVTLSDGKQLVVGGRKFKNNSPAALTDPISIPPVPEVYDPATGRWRILNGATDQALFNRVWYYPRSWLRHNGKVVVADPKADKLFELSVDGNGALTELGSFPGSFGNASSPAAMFSPGKILFVARNRRAEVLDISGDRVSVERTTSSNLARNWGDATVLANGEVFLSGGISTGAATNSGDYPGEIWNPDTGEWTMTAEAQKARLYHSTTMLMPNGRVLVAGGGPPGPVVNMNAEVFIPPYLFNADGSFAARPEISQLGEINYGLEFTATVTNNTPINKVSFIRAGSVTHSFDQGQRYMELDFEQTGNLLNITAPVGAAIAPPGLYMLFVFDQSGVPSQAKLVMMGGEPIVEPPTTEPPITVPPTPEPPTTVPPVTVPPAPEPPTTDPANGNPQNLLINGGFELDQSGWVSCSSEALSSATDRSSRGDKALLQEAGACLYQEYLVTPGTEYTLTCDARTDSSPYSSISINMLDSSYNELASESATVNSANYQSYERSLESPANASLSAITLYSEGPTYFDSCIVKVSSAEVVPPAPPEPAPPEPVEPITTPAGNLLSNSTFEQGKASWTDCAASQLTSIVASEPTGQVLQVENAGCIYQEFPVTVGEQYELNCTAKSEGATYTSATIEMLDQSYTQLAAEVTVIALNTFQNYRATIAAPSGSATGSVTLYSEDVSQFSSCYVSAI